LAAQKKRKVALNPRVVLVAGNDDSSVLGEEPNMNREECPPRDQLVDFAIGTLPEEDADWVIDHLGSCDKCQAALDTIDQAGDTLISKLLRPAPNDEFADESQRRQALERAKAIVGGSPSSNVDYVGGQKGVVAAEESVVLGKLGEYELLAKLGQGGMGTVYKARQTKLKRVVALKLLPMNRLDDERSRARFEREMEAVGQLNHPNIVQALDAREISGTPVLAMEFVDGSDLSQFVADLGPLPIAEACELGRQAALGLQAAHEAGLVHRDIKPSNLMLTRKGMVKILDLGLALLDAGQPNGREMTGSGQTMGTADYMAPEQTFDSHSVDIRADIYSLGCTLYKLLTGHAPFRGPKYATNMAKMMGHVQDPVPSVQQMRPDVPKELVEIVERMMAKQPEDRFAEPSDVATMLQSFAADADLAGLAAVAESKRASTAEGQSLGSTASLHTSALVGTTPSHAPTPRPASSGGRRRWSLKAVAIAVLPLAAILLGVVIWINRTRIEVPEGSEVAVGKDGSVHVETPSNSTKPEDIHSLPTKPPTAPKYPSDDRAPDVAGATEPLSLMALVPKPTRLPGAKSWTLETREPRGEVRAVRFSPDDKLLASAGDDGVIRLWEPKELQFVRAMAGHDGPIHTLAWSPDGKLLASAGDDKTVRLWDPVRCETVQVLEGAEDFATRVLWSPDGKSLVAISGAVAPIWSVPSGTRRCTLRGHEKDIDDLVWSPDSQRLASTSRDTTVRTWDAQDGRQLLRREGQDHFHPCCVAWSPDGHRLAASNGDKRFVRIWESTSGKLIHSLECQNGCGTVAWSPNGRLLAGTASGLYIWDTDTGELKHRLGSWRLVSQPPIHWSKDSNRVTGASRVFNLATGETSHAELPGTWASHITWSTDLTQAAAPSDGSLKVSRTNVKNSVRESQCYGALSGLDWFSNGASLIAKKRDADSGSTVTMIWDTNHSKFLRNLPLSPNSLHQLDGYRQIAMSPTEEKAAFLWGNGHVEIWKVGGLKPEIGFNHPRKRGSHMTWSPNGDRIAVITHVDNHNGEIAVFDLDDATNPRSIPSSTVAHDGKTAWLPNGKQIALVSLGKFCLYDVDSGERVQAVGGGGYTGPFALDRAGARAVVGNTWYSPTYVVDIQAGEILKSEPALPGYHQFISWTADDKSVMKLGRARELLVTDFTSGLVKRRFPVPGSDGKLSPDGRTLVLTDANTLRLVDVEDGVQRGTLMALRGRQAMMIAPDGNYRATGAAEDFAIYIVQTDSGQQLTLAPAEFEKQYGWKNDPGKVNLLMPGGSPAANETSTAEEPNEPK
jgi:serine/threonine protein kinase/Tol biopolymer transport system component